MTVRVVEHVLLVPPEPFAVPVYVVVAAGETVTEPLADVKAPTPWLMEPEIAFWDVQESVAALPLEMDVGLMDKEQLGNGAVTVTVLEHEPVPPAPVTVAVYVVAAAGETLRFPLATGVTEPMP